MKALLVPSAVAADPYQYLTTLLVNGTVALDAGCLGLYGSPAEQARVRHVFLTHAHMDHVATLPIFLENVSDDTADCPTVHAPAEVLDVVRRDLLNDRVEHLLRAVGLDPLRDEVNDPAGAWPVECPRPETGNPAAFPPDQDRDGDRLTDCEEILLRSDPTLFDSDTDGVPDPLELRYGTNLISLDALEDADNDGFTNVDEYKLHLDPLSRRKPEFGALRGWFDLFNHRFIHHFYRAWDKYRFWLAHERGELLKQRIDEPTTLESSREALLQLALRASQRNPPAKPAKS